MERKLLWTQTGVAAATGGSILKPFEVRGVSIDSRDVKEGDLFIALKARRDGHYFVRNAAQSGAVAALVSWKPRSIPRGFPVVFVKNTEEGLQKLAIAARARSQAKIIAITGSAGKTTTKDIMAQLLAKYDETHAAFGSYNNKWGVPLSVARMPAEAKYGVFEVGMNHSGEISPLVQLVRPHIAIITTVGSGHIENFSSEEEIADAKAEIFDGLEEGGIAILNRDNIHFERLKGKAEAKNLKIITFGSDENADARVITSELKEGQNHVVISINGQKLSFVTDLLGQHNALNIAAILAAFWQMGLDLSKAAQLLSEIKPTDGRGNIEHVTLSDETGNFTLIDESYNANPLSMKAALQNICALKPTGEGAKIAVIGEMLELGTQSEKLHTELKDDILAADFDSIYLIGKGTEPLYEALGEDSPSVYALRLDDIIDEIIEETAAGSVVFVKGSNGVGLKNLIERYKSVKKTRHLT
ncbi:MAG: UDP-N-acetylmuramoyl-tripeptide--D-alanyl-D-alanine ligase [Pseudomonadota bacterium]